MEEQVIEELKAWKRRFGDLFEQLGNASDRDSLRIISEKYSELKSDIQNREKELTKPSARSSLNVIEKTILVPAVREAALHCKAPKGSTNKQKLSSSLYDGQDYMSHWLGELNA